MTAAGRDVKVDKFILPFNQFIKKLQQTAYKQMKVNLLYFHFYFCY